MEKKDQKSRIMRLLAQVVIIMAGLSVYAAGVALFVLPMDMIAAGTTGVWWPSITGGSPFQFLWLDLIS